MAKIQYQKKRTGGKGWKNEKIFTRESPYEALKPSKKLIKKVKDIAKPFIEESVLLRKLIKKDKK